MSTVPNDGRSAVLGDALRVLSLRATGADIARLDRRHLAFGLACTWIVGIGRWWDDPRATALQKTGLGSVVYVFALALVLWLFALPVGRPLPSWRRLLTYVTLTAPPALLYAIPVERWTSLPVARAINAWFLGIVAAWRVAMYFVFLVRGLRLSLGIAFCTALLPIALVISTLALLNLEHAMFDFMSGMHDDGTPHDQAYLVVVVLTWWSSLASPVLLVTWLLGVWWARQERRASRRDQENVAR